MSDNGTVPFHTLRFVGRMNAHISHDIKNVVATISETAGLLDDLLAMQAAGKEVDPERFSKLGARILQQVERGNALLANMNVLAHSTDEPTATTDLNRTLAVMAGLARCVPDYRAVQAQPVPGDPALPLRPYYLEQFIYLVYRAAFPAMPQDGKLALSARAEGGGWIVAVDGLPETLDPAHTAHLDELAALLGGAMNLDADAGRLELRLPGA